jgi:hypothetical protein
MPVIHRLIEPILTFNQSMFLERDGAQTSTVSMQRIARIKDCVSGKVIPCSSISERPHSWR